jgi:hypothetical protein
VSYKILTEEEFQNVLKYLVENIPYDYKKDNLFLELKRQIKGAYIIWKSFQLFKKAYEKLYGPGESLVLNHIQLIKIAQKLFYKKDRRNFLYNIDSAFRFGILRLIKTEPHKNYTLRYYALNVENPNWDMVHAIHFQLPPFKRRILLLLRDNERMSLEDIVQDDLLQAIYKATSRSNFRNESEFRTRLKSTVRQIINEMIKKKVVLYDTVIGDNYKRRYFYLSEQAKKLLINVEMNSNYLETKVLAKVKEDLNKLSDEEMEILKLKREKLSFRKAVKYTKMLTEKNDPRYLRARIFKKIGDVYIYLKRTNQKLYFIPFDGEEPLKRSRGTFYFICRDGNKYYLVEGAGKLEDISLLKGRLEGYTTTLRLILPRFIGQFFKVINELTEFAKEEEERQRRITAEIWKELGALHLEGELDSILYYSSRKS